MGGLDNVFWIDYFGSIIVDLKYNYYGLCIAYCGSRTFDCVFATDHGFGLDWDYTRCRLHRGCF